MTIIPAIRNLYLVATHTRVTGKSRDMAIPQKSVFVIRMVVGTLFSVLLVVNLFECLLCFFYDSCDCDHQNEGYAVRNLATYGPAVVCLDASTWQDYTEGIITSDSGCSAGFMDVNHCVQAVGYAYMSDEEYQDEMDGKNSGDRNHNSNDGSRDSTQRKGYWIVRNQWSKYWGMSGYAYVAMGENTCGILNDMMQAYT